MTNHSGSCLCGVARFSVQGDFDRFYLCHCHYCQKDTGSAHAANLFSQSATLTWQSGEEAITTFTLPGTRHARSFCQHCGSAMPTTLAGGILVVPAGCLDTDLTVAPTAHLFVDSKSAWESQTETIPGFPGLPE